MSSWVAELAWTGERLERRLWLEVKGGRLSRVERLGDRPLPAGAGVLSGLTLPGLADAHVHSFHRALRGRTQLPSDGSGDFWGWRERMYALASVLSPEEYFELARAALGELALAGVTAVGEFQYLHHRPDGQPYSGPAMELALIAAAEEAGVRLTLLDTCYLRPGFGPSPPGGAVLRFADDGVEGWERRVAQLREGATVRLGAAVHSVRAVRVEGIRRIADWAGERSAPLHFHLSEQPAENQACLEATGRTPTQLLDDCGALSEGSTAVHAIHLTDEDVARLGASGTSVCVCPTTERDLGDGVCPADRLLEAGARLCLGSDSNAVCDLFEEARAVELDLRLVRGRRGLVDPQRLLRAATSEGMRSLGWEAGELREGMLADFISLDLDSPRLAGAGEQDLLPRVLYGAGAADVRSVVVGGREVVREGRHERLGSVGERLNLALRRVEPDWHRAAGGGPG